MGFASNNVDYVGQRTTGSGGRVTSPSSDRAGTGELPPGVRTVAPSPTPWVLVLGRTLVDGGADLPGRPRAAGSSSASPRSTAGGARMAAAPGRATCMPRRLWPRTRSGPWKTLNAMLGESAAHAPRAGPRPVRPDRDRAGSRRRRPAGRGEAGPDPCRRHRHGTAATAVPQRRLGDHRQRLALPAAPQEGRLGSGFLRRAADQSLAGITANDPGRVGLPRELRRCRRAEAFTADGRYQLRFECRRAAARWTRSASPWPPTPPGTST